MGAKQSGVIRMIQKVREEERQRYSMQLQAHAVIYKQAMADIAQISLAEAFPEGAERIPAFVEKLGQNFEEFCDLWNEDTRDREYALDRLDTRLQQVAQESFQPFPERYGMSIEQGRGIIRDRELEERTT